MNESKVAIRCGEHAFTRFQKLLPQQDRLLPKIYQTTDDQYIIYWDNIYWYETYNSNEAEIVKAFGQAFDYLEERPFDQNGDLLPGYEFEFLKFETDSGDYQYRSNDWEVRICMEKSIRLPENLKELSPETGEETNTYVVAFLSGNTPCINLAIAKTKEKVKEYFANILDVKESDFISIRLANEDDKHPGVPVHHIPEYPYILHIEYSWGDQEPAQKFSTKKDAWDKAMSMAMTEADTASDEKEDGTAEIIMNKTNAEITLVYPRNTEISEESSFCRYYISIEKGEYIL